MTTRFLFRLDSSRENDGFMALRRARNIDYVYSGAAMKVGPGWIPDFVEVSVDAPTGKCRLTLIELEATHAAASISSRKYLPESSASILEAFAVYLDSVLSQCRSTADPRIDGFQELKNLIVGTTSVTIYTAGALRTSPDFLEELPLIDQPAREAIPIRPALEATRAFLLEGERVLSREENNGLRRTIRILDAVIMGRDHSGGTLHSWRNLRTKPLDDAVFAQPDHYPELKKHLASKADAGLRINCDSIAKELSELWSHSEHLRLRQEQVGQFIESFYTIAVSFEWHDQMRHVFEKARAIVDAKTT